MGKPGKVEVPPVGPEDADIMLVGEAPGQDEEHEKEPFVGKSGQFLMRYLGRVGFQREDVFLTNLSKRRPSTYSNSFKLLQETETLKKGLEALSEEIERVDPNVIVALGAWPMYYLTGQMSSAQRAKPGSGVTQWRGSVIEGIGDHVPAAEGRKILVTFHPAYIVRPTGFQNHPLFHLDLRRLKEESKTPELLHPSYDALIDPPGPEEVAREMMESDWLSVDIETFGESLACVGFADSEKRGLCLTYENPLGWDVAKALLASNVPKIFQFGTFDINYLDHFYGWETNAYAFDTYIAAANLLPEMPRGLDFLASIYTNFPFYKEERKTWRQEGSMRVLWEYNVKDVIATYIIAMEQMRELEVLYDEG